MSGVPVERGGKSLGAPAPAAAEGAREREREEEAESARAKAERDEGRAEREVRVVGEAHEDAPPALASGELGLDRQLVQAVGRARGALTEPAQEGARVMEVAEVTAGPTGLGEAREELGEAISELGASSGEALGDLGRALLEQDAGLGLELARVQASEELLPFGEAERADPSLTVGSEARALSGIAQESAERGHDVEAHAGAALGSRWRRKSARSRSSWA